MGPGILGTCGSMCKTVDREEKAEVQAMLQVTVPFREGHPWVTGSSVTKANTHALFLWIIWKPSHLVLPYVILLPTTCYLSWH